MRKGRDGGENKKKKNEKKKIKTFLVATNVVASRPPERRPTATPTARAKIVNLKKLYQFTFFYITFDSVDGFPKFKKWHVTMVILHHKQQKYLLNLQFYCDLLSNKTWSSVSNSSFK